MKRMLCLALFLLPSLALGQDKPDDPPPPEIDPKAVNSAIDKGMRWLLTKYSNNRIPEQKYAELVLLTLVHAGLPAEHPILRENFQKVLDRPLNDTYNAGLRGLLLEKVNRKFYQQSLAEIALFFAENQCDNGQWNYNGRNRKLSPTVYAPVPTAPSKKKPAPGSTQVMDRNDGPPPGKEFKLPRPSRATSRRPATTPTPSTRSSPSSPPRAPTSSSPSRRGRRPRSGSSPSRTATAAGATRTPKRPAWASSPPTRARDR